VRRDEVATWRQSHGSGSHKCNVEVRELQSDHLTISPDEDVSSVHREQNEEVRLSTKHYPTVTGDV